MLTPIKKNSPNQCARSNWDGKNWVPDIFVYHIADGFESGLDWMCNPVAQISSHFFITKTGKVYQLVPLNMAAWTQGLVNPPSHPNYSDSKHSIIKSRAVNPNAYCLSIEYEGFYNDYYSNGVLKAKGCKGKITDEQVKATIELMPYVQSEMKRLYGTQLKLDRVHHIGHCEINPTGRPCCPGELFPYNEIISGYNGDDYESKDNDAVNESTNTKYADDFFLKTLSGARMSNPYNKGTHTGIDYALSVGTKVFSPVDGTVTKVDNTVIVNTYGKDSYGIYVVVQSSDKYYHFFAHLSKVAPGLKVGDKIKCNDLIGLSGNTGNSSGPHLHYEIRAEAQYLTDINPNGYDYSKVNKEQSVPNNNSDAVELVLKNQPLFASSTAKTATRNVNGTMYRYDDGIYNGRIRVTQKREYVKKEPAGTYVTGYIELGEKPEPKSGDKVTLSNTAVYGSSMTNVVSKRISGTYYLYDGKLYSGRYRICPSLANVGKNPASQNVTGYVRKEDI